ncbi:MAG: FkbM family methyltransferase [Thermoplasmata archaeon]|jgi:FkbM family methyltransferase
MSIAERGPAIVRVRHAASDLAASWVALRNWPTYWLQLRGRYPVDLRFQNDFVLPHADRHEAETLVFLAANGARFARTPERAGFVWGMDPDRRILTTPSGIRFHLESVEGGILAETFLYDIHHAAGDLSGRLVVDAGANVGDTALYFAERGADVLAYEPDPENFRALEANLVLNPELAAHITTFPIAIGEDGEILFRAGQGGAGRPAAAGEDGIRVKSVSLATLLGDRPRAHLLKSDCKGSEYDMVLQEAIARFDHVALEYTSSSDPLRSGPWPLAEALRRHGFGAPRIFRQNPSGVSLAEHGVIESTFVGRP